MAEITAATIKKLRDITGVGMSKCKEALTQVGGDIDEAVSYLRKAGMASAAKKADREANEGKIAAAENDSTLAVVEIASETDFVANNERFVAFLEDVANEVANSNPASLEEFLSSKYSKDPSMTIEEYRGSVVQAIGENIQIKRFKTFPKSSEKSIGVYSHMGGKLFTVIEIEGSQDAVEIARDIAMHAAAASPEEISPESISEELINKEKEIAEAQLKESGKPENIWEKIIAGKVNSFLDQVCLLRQKYVRDESVTVAQYVEKKSKELGKGLKVTNMLRWSVGDAS